eukprot:272327-Chlamydomonas_euryale.AAC.2
MAGGRRLVKTAPPPSGRANAPPRKSMFKTCKGRLHAALKGAAGRTLMSRGMPDSTPLPSTQLSSVAGHVWAHLDVVGDARRRQYKRLPRVRLQAVDDVCVAVHLRVSAVWTAGRVRPHPLAPLPLSEARTRMHAVTAALIIS